MIPYVLYDLTDGRILAYGTAPSPQIAGMQVRQGAEVMTGYCTSDEKQYVALGDVPAVIDRPEVCPPTVTVPLGSEAVAVTPPLPEGTVVTFAGQPVELSADNRLFRVPSTPGLKIYFITPPFPYRLCELAVTVEG